MVLRCHISLLMGNIFYTKQNASRGIFQIKYTLIKILLCCTFTYFLKEYFPERLILFHENSQYYEKSRL